MAIPTPETIVENPRLRTAVVWWQSINGLTHASNDQAQFARDIAEVDAIVADPERLAPILRDYERFRTHTRGYKGTLNR